MVQSYDQYQSICRAAISSVQGTLHEISNAGENQAGLWNLRDDLYELESELLEMQWDLVEIQEAYEELVGQIFSGNG